MYSKIIMEEFYNPQNYGVIKGASGVGKVVSDIGSEIIKIYISVQNNKIVDAQFQTFGGVLATATSSIASRLMKDKNVGLITKVTPQHLLEIIGEIPENKMYIVQAVVNAMHGAVLNYANKNA